ncbi:MAG: DUF3256 family protein [Bacteroidales bacterium]
MKKTTLFILSLIAFCSAVSGQSAAVYFEIIPEQHLLQIESNRRKDMLDMKKAGQKAAVPNRLGGVSEMTDLTDNYLRIQTSENAAFEMKLFPYRENEQMIAVIKTVCAPVCDSEISFYTTTWEALPLADHFQLPGHTDFIKDSIDRNDPAFKQAIRSIDMDLIQFSFASDRPAVIATQSYESYLPDYIWKELQPYLKKEIQVEIR